MAPVLIGFTGKRGVGKSCATEAVEHLGFKRLHTFAIGKATSKAYFKHAGASGNEAERMINGDLKDLPSALLPHNSTPRYFMEQLGFFLGVKLGPDWTLGIEMNKELMEDENAKLVFESIVYESDYLQHQGGIIIKIIRPDHKGPIGIHTDSAVERIKQDYTIINDGTVYELQDKIKNLIFDKIMFAPA